MTITPHTSIGEIALYLAENRLRFVELGAHGPGFRAALRDERTGVVIHATGATPHAALDAALEAWQEPGQ